MANLEYYLKAQAAGGGSSSSGAKILKTHQLTSQRTGDDGDIQAGRDVNFLEMSVANPFGNVDRFSATDGSVFTFPGNTIIDWSTYDGSTVLGYGFYSNGGASGSTWADAVDDALAYSDGTYTSGWRLPNIKELYNLVDLDKAYYPLDYYPFNVIGVQYRPLWSSTSLASGPTINAWYLDATFSQTKYVAKTQTAVYSLPVREFTVTGTVLT